MTHGVAHHSSQPVYPTTSRLRRLVNYGLDRMLALGLAGALAVAGLIVLGLLRIDVPEVVTLLLIGTTLVVVYGLYYFVAEWLTGRTLAKYLTRTQVLDVNARPMSASQALFRSVARLVPLNEVSILFDKNNRTWHDRASHTVVVDPRAVPPEYRPRGERPVQVIVVALLLLLPGTIVVTFIYQMFTGGQRFDLPKTMPPDLRLTKFETIPDDGARHYRLTYSGNGRVVELTRLLPGFHFDADQPCVYTRPTKSGLLYEPLDKALTCTEIAHGEEYSAFEVKGQSPNPAIEAVTPDYILEGGDRYGVKATTGHITREEVEEMVDRTVTFTEADLRKTARTAAAR